MSLIKKGGGLAAALLCALSMLAVAASAAQAEAPEYGRCVKLPKHSEGTGYAHKSNCTEPTESKPKFAWLPGPGPAAEFTISERFGYSPKFHHCVTASQDEQLAERKEAEAATAPEPEKAQLLHEAEQLRTTATQNRELAGESKTGCEKLVEKEQAKGPFGVNVEGKNSVSCGGLSGSGEYTGAKTVGGIEVTFTECESKLGTCQTPGAGAGEIDLDRTSGELGVLERREPPNKTKLGVDWTPEAGTTLLEYECGGVVTVVSGSLIHETAADKMATVQTERAGGSGGVQDWQSFEGGPTDVPSSTTGGVASAHTLVHLHMFVKNEEPIEANSIV